MTNMRIKIISVLAVFALTLMAGAASAAEYYLTNTNTQELDGISVKVITDGDGKTISVKLDNNPVTNTPLGIDAFYYNLNNPITGADESGWHFNALSTTADGFGNFAIKGSGKPAGTGGISSPIVFTLTDTFTNIPTNGHSATIAVHVRFSDGCSGWVSDGITTSSQSNSACKPSTSVPEFPTIALPIAGIMGLVFIFQQRRKMEE